VFDYSSGCFHPLLGRNVNFLVDFTDFTSGFLNTTSLQQLKLDVLVDDLGNSLEHDNGVILNQVIGLVEEGSHDTGLITKNDSSSFANIFD
jgi:hypothetical protein